MVTEKSPAWQTGNPTEAGFYVVAISYDDGMGFMGADYWDTERGWSLDDNIVGFIRLRDVLNAAKIEFPE